MPRRFGRLDNGENKETMSTRDIVAMLREDLIALVDSRRIGLVIGIEKYRDERLNVRCARSDAQELNTSSNNVTWEVSL